MPFITQGKTNWKFLVIVIILAAIIGGGSMFYLKYFFQPSLTYNPPPVSPKVFSTKEECEEKTECDECVFVTCDVIPLGKTLEEVCGKDFKAGWQCIKSTDETADWETCTNEKYGFEIKYPPFFTLTSPKLVYPKEDEFYLDSFRASFKCGGLPGRVCHGKTFALRIITRPFDQERILEFVGEPEYLVPMRRKMVINGREIYVFKGGDAGEGWEIGLIPLEKEVLKLILASGDENREIESGEITAEFYPVMADLFDQMLSTFKLIEEFCGTSTNGSCVSDSDCIATGCSGQVCWSKNEESLVTTCEWKACYRAKDYGFECKCVNSKCQWLK